jgi:polysaccharide export outer membrane protein
MPLRKILKMARRVFFPLREFSDMLHQVKLNLFPEMRFQLFIFLVFAAQVVTLFGQLSSSQQALVASMTPEQRQQALAKLKAQGSIPSTTVKPVAPAPPIRPRNVEQEDPAQEFKEKRGFLSELNSMEAIAQRDLSKLEGERSESPGPVPELLEAIAETEALLRKIKRLQRREIEKRAEEFAESGQSAVSPFGYDLFAGSPTTFAPGNVVPVPLDYTIGPGDVIEIQLFGQENSEYTLQVNREGMIQFPKIGPINVFENGIDFLSLKNLLKEKVRENLGAGVQLSISMGSLRSIRIFILGDVHRPGAYLVSSLSTMTNALLVSGGIKHIGSLRNIQLKRNGKLVTTLDLYDLLLKGDMSQDERLRPGDVIFAPPVMNRVTVTGTVLRPAIYELSGESTIAEVLDLCGGILPRGDGRYARLERSTQEGLLKIYSLDLNSKEGQEFPVLNGDVLSVPSTLDRMNNVVSLVGHVERPGDYEWKETLSLRDLLPDYSSLLPKADMNYALIRRENPETGLVSVLSFRPLDVLRDGNRSKSVDLRPRDQVMIFGLSAKDRLKLLTPILGELSLQDSSGSRPRIATVGGIVHFPGNYPLMEGMTIADLLRASGGLRSSAYTLGAELTRHSIIDGEKVIVEHKVIESLDMLESSEDSTFFLQPQDSVTVKQIPEWHDGRVIWILGEVKFPGSYVIKPGETLKDVFARAGGMTERAFPFGAVFTREELKKRESEHRRRISERLESEIAVQNLRSSDDTRKESSDVALSLLARMKASKAVGRLVVDLESQLDGSSGTLLVLRDGDVVMVPKSPQEISVIGEVHNPTSHLYDKKLSSRAYIELSGGLMEYADKDAIFSVHADGSVSQANRTGWFRSGTRRKLGPGDVIVVPITYEKDFPWDKAALITQVVYQLAIATAAANSF